MLQGEHRNKENTVTTEAMQVATRKAQVRSINMSKVVSFLEGWCSEGLSQTQFTMNTFHCSTVRLLSEV